MPKRTDIRSILVIGAGPIIIGQACEFDYSGSQAIKALRDEGYRVVLVNSNPATIMTDPGLADATYVEPITPEIVELIIERERPDALLPTMGGQTALNTALALEERGVLERYGVEMIGARADAIDKAEDRLRFRDAMDAIGLESPKSRLANASEMRDADRKEYEMRRHALDGEERAAFEAEWQSGEVDRKAAYVAEGLRRAKAALGEIGLPTIIRPSFTMGGTGGGIAYNEDEFDEIARGGLDASPTTEILVEESVLGWKEYEMEVVRDRNDNCIIVCAIENLDPMGVHTGDSITVAPALTLTDKEYQIMRNASIAVLREIGVETGGSNVQFAVNPKDGRLVVIEMNPRVSRSSALASKATGFPIAKVAAKLAVGYTLDELENDITGGATPASFEPTIDYVVTKIPRFAFEKFPGASEGLTTAMKSVGEVMAIGRSFTESFQKALRGLETGLSGLDEIDVPGMGEGDDDTAIRAALAHPTPRRILYTAQAMRHGWSEARIHEATRIDPWFLARMGEIIAMEERIRVHALPDDADNWLAIKGMGFSDRRLATLTGSSEGEVRAARHALGVRPVHKRIDTCAAEFVAPTPYMYSTYERPFAGAMRSEAGVDDRRKVVILGGGPNRIGQGIEFDYCCCHAAYALADAGIQSVMINCNPETVSTDYDTSDRLYFEPLTAEDVLEVIDAERASGELLGVIVQYGGQTPLGLAKSLEEADVPILGTSRDAIDLAEDRDRFQALLTKLKLLQPENGIARSAKEARKIAGRIGYPLVIRPSYVLGGRAMEIVRSDEQFERYVNEAVVVSGDTPVLIDRYLSGAIEVDVDCLADGTHTHVAGIMEHIEEAGIHSGDSACSLPVHSLSDAIVAEITRQTEALAKALNVRGLMNVQFAVKDGRVYVIEVNPRASRTVPFVAKTHGVPFAKVAARVMAGMDLPDALAAYGGSMSPAPLAHVAVKEAVFPFSRFPGVDVLLGPEMRSTGEVMGLDTTYAMAFAKAQLGAGQRLPTRGAAFVSVRDGDKAAVVPIARRLAAMGHQIVATGGTHKHLMEAGVEATRINKVREGRPHVEDAIRNREIALVVNTVETDRSVHDGLGLRRAALMNKLPYITTIAGAEATALAMEAMRAGPMEVRPLQDYAVVRS